jgi:hypothetical protein
MNSNLVLLHLVSRYNASVWPLSFWTKTKQTNRKKKLILCVFYIELYMKVYDIPFYFFSSTESYETVHSDYWLLTSPVFLSMDHSSGPAHQNKAKQKKINTLFTSNCFSWSVLGNTLAKFILIPIPSFLYIIYVLTEWAVLVEILTIAP